MKVCGSSKVLKGDVAQWVKNPPTGLETQEMSVQTLGQKDSLEKEMTTHSSILVWEIPRTEKLGRLQFMGSQELDTTYGFRSYVWMPS